MKKEHIDIGLKRADFPNICIRCGSEMNLQKLQISKSWTVKRLKEYIENCDFKGKISICDTCLNKKKFKKSLLCTKNSGWITFNGDSIYFYRFPGRAYFNEFKDMNVGERIEISSMTGTGKFDSLSAVWYVGRFRYGGIIL